MNLRAAEEKDFEAIKELWKTEKPNLSIPFTSEIMNCITEHRMFVITNEEEKVIAFCAYKILVRNPAVCLKHLCVNKEYRRNGYGKLLFQKINAITPKHLPLVLTCRDGAENNLFYDKYSLHKSKEERKTLTVRTYILDRIKLGEFK